MIQVKENLHNGFRTGLSYLNENNKLVAIDLSKQQVLNFDPGTRQQIDCAGIRSAKENTIMFLIVEEVKQIILDFPQETVKVLQTCSTNVFAINVKYLISQSKRVFIKCTT